jgi:hypothetical protein
MIDLRGDRDAVHRPVLRRPGVRCGAGGCDDFRYTSAGVKLPLVRHEGIPSCSVL